MVYTLLYEKDEALQNKIKQYQQITNDLLAINDSLGLKDASLISLEYYKKVLGEPFNTESILTLIEDNEDVVRENSYLLYQLFDEQRYLKISYDMIIENSETLEDELKVKYLNYPDQKRIIEEWEKVQS